MHLLNTTTIQLHEFFGSNVPKYGILSHRWEDGEISFKKVTKSRNLKAPGWAKVRQCCELARTKFKREWVWIDTCCIDKKSSAELSEAINSMFKWYADAEECYAYLNDVAASEEDAMLEQFKNSRWFTRGWTLQELLAPKEVYFLNQDWSKIIGTRNYPESPNSPWYLGNHISHCTGIDTDSLENPFGSQSHAQKMCWASGRVCAREEDTAYSLLGLFKVNIPLLYGEGAEKAFSRLQQEILKTSNDETIFAWESTNLVMGMLAKSPFHFRESGTLISLRGRSHDGRPAYMMTNKGLQFSVRCRDLVQCETYSYHGYPVYQIPLNCVSGQNRSLVQDWDRCGIWIVNLRGPGDSSDNVCQDSPSIYFRLPASKLTKKPPRTIQKNTNGEGKMEGISSQQGLSNHWVSIYIR